MRRRRILLISPVPTHPPIAGNRTRVDGLLSSLRALGHEVYLLHVRKEKGDDEKMRRIWGERFLSVPYSRPGNRLARAKRQLGALFTPEARYIYSIDEWYDPSLNRVLADLQSRLHFDAVVVVYVFFSKALECFGSDVLKILDTHDVFSNRHRLYLESGQKPHWFSTSERQEAKGLNRGDVIIAITDKEREFFSRLTPKKVMTIGHLVALDQPLQNEVRPGRILFVASHNPVNVEGLKYFVREVLPLITERVQGVELVLAGTICNVAEIGEGPGILKLGRVDDLKPVYDSASLVINPVLVNTGLSIKNLEALGYAKPLVTAPVGTEGLEDGIGSAFLVGETPQEFATHVLDLLSDSERSIRLARGASQYASNYNRQVVQKLQDILA